MNYRIQTFHPGASRYVPTNNESDDLEALKRLVDSAMFRDSRVRVVDDSRRVHYEPSAGITTFQTTSSSGSATAEKVHDGIRSTATIELSVASGMEFCISIPGDLARDLDALPECDEFYPTADRLYRGCLAGVSEGIFDISRDFRDVCGCIKYTRIAGTRLPLRFNKGFEIAAAIALLRALKRPEQLPAYMAKNADGWRVAA